MQFYLSEIFKKSVLNKSHEKIGILKDVVIVDINKTFPQCTGIILERGTKKDAVFIPMQDLAMINPKQIKQSTDVVDLTPFSQRDDEVLLNFDLYDKQIVDIDDRRLTRVNDLLLEEKAGKLRLIGADISVLGIMRRLRIPNLITFMKSNIVEWEDVQFLGGNAPVKFKIQYKNLESLHPVDIGRIIVEGPGYKQGGKLLSSLKDPIAADIIEELSPTQQKNFIETMGLEDVADVVENMPPDKAADLLHNLGAEYAKKILPLIKKEETQKIEALLTYPEHTTGAFMTTDYFVVPQDYTIDQVSSYLRSLAEIPDFTTYVYVVENLSNNKLVGILALQDCLIQDKRVRISTIMNHAIISAAPQDHIKKSLKRLYRYNISAIPVLFKPDKTLLGVLTFRDAITVYLPRKWKNRTRQVFSNEYTNDH